MNIAVTYADGRIYQHFGHTAFFKIYEVAGDTVVAARIVETGTAGHGALAGFLAANRVDVLICGGIGGGARNALEAAGIRLYGGVSGDADDAVEAFLTGNLDYDPCARCSHHDQGHSDHTCGSHGCGSHSCHEG